MALSPLEILALVVGFDFLLVGLLLLGRAYVSHLRRKQEKFIQKWRPVLMQYSMGGEQPQLPHLKRRERQNFLILWNQSQQQLSGNATPRLNQLLKDLQLQPFARQLGQSRSLRKQLIATQCLGHLQDPESWPLLVKKALSEHVILSFSALQALVQMSPEAALPVILEVLRQERCSNARLLGLFRRYPSPHLVNPLIQALQEALYAHETALALKIIALIEVLPYPAILPTMRQILVEAQEAHLQIACLKSMRQLHDPWLIQLAEPFLSSTDMHVRQAACKALGAVARPAQIPLFLQALSDESEWVAQSAYQALLAMPGLKRERLETLQSEHPELLVRQRLERFRNGQKQ